MNRKKILVAGIALAGLLVSVRATAVGPQISNVCRVTVRVIAVQQYGDPRNPRYADDVSQNGYNLTLEVKKTNGFSRSDAQAGWGDCKNYSSGNTIQVTEDLWGGSFKSYHRSPNQTLRGTISQENSDLKFVADESLSKRINTFYHHIPWLAVVAAIAILFGVTVLIVLRRRRKKTASAPR